jgi:hypothetical protein
VDVAASVLDDVIAEELEAPEDEPIAPETDEHVTDLELTAEHHVLETPPENELGEGEDEPDAGDAAGAGALDLVQIRKLAGVPLFYPIPTPQPHKPSVDRGFLPILEATVRQTQARVPASYGKLLRIQELGIFVPTSDRLHTKGRACDWERLIFEHVTIAPGDGDHASESRAVRRRYWAFAAICRSNSCFMLHGLYNADHENHIHQDNGISQGFNTMESTVKLCQALLNFIHGQSPHLATDGHFGTSTQNALTATMQRLHIEGTVQDAQAWTRFLRMTGRLGFKLAEPHA